MTLYLIGLGLNKESLSEEGKRILKSCDRIYLESYTVDFPYEIKELENFVGKKLNLADRELVESLKLVEEARKKNIALLIYGSPLTATTHISLIQEAIKQKVGYKIIYNASVLDAVAETGLQIYKFGKITSMPAWKKNFEPTSFMKIVKDNQKINAHSLILVDIGLELKDAIRELKESAKKEKVKVDKIVICSRMGTDDKTIFYGELKNLENKEIEKPYCLIIPGKLHFVEEEVLKISNGIFKNPKII